MSYLALEMYSGGIVHVAEGGGGLGGGLVQWVNVPAWKVEYRRFEPRSGIQVSKK